MPIVFVHGVGVRDTDPEYSAWWEQLQRLLREWIAPAIAPDPENVAITMAYWGAAGAHFAWDGASFPWRGAQAAEPPPAPVSPAVVPAPITATEAAAATGPAITRPLDASDLIGAAPAAPAALDPAALPTAGPSFWQGLLGRRSTPAASGATTLAEVNAAALLSGVGEYLDSVRSGTARLSGAFTARVMTEVRRSLADLLTMFFADVFTYLAYRGTPAAPGPIPARVLETLAAASANAQARGGEPLVVLTHSMGGQVLYDILTAFLPGIPWLGDIRVDFWGATASQVALFEELKLFLASRPEYSAAHGNRAPFPDRRYLGAWWNVWNPTDFLSYPAAGVIEGVDDEAYAGSVLATRAHDAYLRQPGFFQAFADKVRAARARDWDR